jgi:arsenical pump membrane protein
MLPGREALVAVPAALLVLAIGAISLDDAWDQLSEIAPTLGFLAAMLVVAAVCDRDGLFVAAGAWMAKRSRHDATRLLALVFAVAAAVTVALSLDTTVLLLTPVVIATANRMRLNAQPYSYTCIHLANSASLLLPISNLSNLLAFQTTGVSFIRFGGLMLLPWLGALAVQWVVLRGAFRRELADEPVALGPDEHVTVPRHVLPVLGLSLVAFAASSAVDLDPAWIALATAIALGVPALVKHRIDPAGVARALNVPFLLFVAGLAIIVEAVREHGLQDVVSAVVPNGDALLPLLAIAAIAALLANLVNNLPAILILLPVVGPLGTGPVLAALIGVNVGPNLTYVGSLATLLWRRVLEGHGQRPGLARFTALGVIVVPSTLLVSTTALWLALQALG